MTEVATPPNFVGGLGVDNITKLRLLDRPSLEASLGFTLGPRNLLVTFHPVTLERDSVRQMGELLAALETLPDAHLIFTMPNADTDGRALREMIEAFVATHPNARAFTSLGQLRYLSCMRLADGVVGNSSSGLTEAPTFGTLAPAAFEKAHSSFPTASFVVRGSLNSVKLSSPTATSAAKSSRESGPIRSGTWPAVM